MPQVSIIFNILSLVLGFFGHITWYMATFLYPSHKPDTSKWYGFSEIKEQHKMAAILGIAASIMGVLAIAFPIMLIPSGWCFLAGNVYWVISEYHKLSNPPKDDPAFNEKKQTDYLYYALLTATIAFISALSITLSFILPPAGATILLTCSTLLGISLGVLAFEYWLASSFGHDTPVARATEPTKAIERATDNSITPPCHYKNPLQTQITHNLNSGEPSLEDTRSDDEKNTDDSVSLGLFKN